MNENQIIQALKICHTDTTCRTCPYYSMKAANCIAELINDALELIKKQNEEIRNLTHKHHNECGQLAKYSDECNKLLMSTKRLRKKEKIKKVCSFLIGFLSGMIVLRWAKGK
jgi:Mg2+ and Co2+ transporter CorA